ncbi:MAG: hypothetical protein ABJO86_19035 [Lentilitoribacter sp.]
MGVFKPVSYKSLNSRQKENYNFQKVAGELADFGFNCIRLSDDWNGADFIACHMDGVTFLKIQLKGRLTINNKYRGRDIHIAFLHGADCYVYPHDELQDRVFELGKVKHAEGWQKTQAWDWPSPPKWAMEVLVDYKV